MSDDPLHPPRADEASRALRDVGQRREQAARGAMGEARWVSVVFGVVLFADLAAPDFFGDGVRPWLSWTVLVLVLAYLGLLRSRRGSDLLGRPARVRKSEISPGFARWSRLTILAVMVLGLLAALYGDGPTFPYEGTALGAVLGIALIAFGPALQRGLSSLATRRPGEDGAPSGSR